MRCLLALLGEEDDGDLAVRRAYRTCCVRSCRTFMPQQWLARTSARDVDSADRGLELLVYGPAPLGDVLCCDVTRLSALTRERRPRPSAAARGGAAWHRYRCRKEARNRIAYPELLRPRPQRLCILACKVGGRWSAESRRFVTHRWWGSLSVALQSTVVATLFGALYVAGCTGSWLDLLVLRTPKTCEKI
ncbi:hypothetical protein AK812_SmicGene48998 [Symbiodinium microadriaticum]|uniref:Uncharacterized protein n=1 Tax=Symbiodinium microadriaticum TaxID=2951 RepID=A0A1Q8ZK51_SYMMI|nr:hypothetical protein AK812_SmicGene48998 [Symbiodinium microadriaticum]